jgi:serine/threonine-protein kinase
MVADFGIALALSAAAGGRMTETGLSLGTPHYMSPEQATAEKEITGRSDVYSLASVLYEMLSGEPPHMGKSAQQIIMKIIAEPVKPVTDLRRSVPAHVADALAQALEKLPADRFASAAEFAAALQGKIAGRTTVRAAAVAGRSGLWRRAALAAGALSLGLVAFSAWALTRAPARPVVRVSVAFPAVEGVRSAATRRFDLSRDGARIVYIGPDSGGTQLWVRELRDLNARPLPGTRDAVAPFFSPDGRSVGFFRGQAGRDLRVIALSGGQPTTIVRDSAQAWGADWGEDGNIYFVHSTSRLARVAATGGAIEVISVLDTARGETEHDWPQLLPGGKRVLVQVWHNSIADTEIAVIDLATGRTTHAAAGVYARYLPSGHLVYVSFDGSLVSAPFDPERVEVTGQTIAIADAVQLDALSGSGQFAISHNGTMVYAPGGGIGGEQVVWIDRAGRMVPVDTAWRGQFSNLALSPDGSRLAVTVLTSEGQQVWVKQLPTGPLSRLTFGSTSSYRQIWHPDGRHISFIRLQSAKGGVWMQRFDGSAPAESVLSLPSRPIDELVWSPDGRTTVFRAGSGGSGSRDVMALTRGTDSVPRPIAAGGYDEFAADISPNGRWIAYVSTESGRSEIFVRRLDDPAAGRTQVSVEGGEEPRWAHNGRELFFRSGRGAMLVAELAPGPAFSVKSLRTLFTLPNLNTDPFHRAYDITRDDQRFVMTNRSLGALTELVLVLNWSEELRRR